MTREERPAEKGLEYYLSLSYAIEVREDKEEGGYVVSIPALPGCVTQVEKWEEAQSSIEEVRKEWMTTAYEDGVEIPLPGTDREYSGKFVVRVPKFIHRELDARAGDEGVSLNTLLVSMISQCLGVPKARTSPSATNTSTETSTDPLEKLMNRPSSETRRYVVTRHIGGTEVYASINTEAGERHGWRTKD
jgi:antitoxin HicB